MDTLADPLSPVHVDCPTCGADRTARCYDRRANRDSAYSTMGDRGLVDKNGNPRYHKERIARARHMAGGL